MKSVHLANAAAGISVGAGMMTGPEAVDPHTVNHVGLVCSDRRAHQSKSERRSGRSVEGRVYWRGLAGISGDWRGWDIYEND